MLDYFTQFVISRALHTCIIDEHIYLTKCGLRLGNEIRHLVTLRQVSAEMAYLDTVLTAKSLIIYKIVCIFMFKLYVYTIINSCWKQNTLWHLGDWWPDNYTLDTSYSIGFKMNEKEFGVYFEPILNVIILRIYIEILVNVLW